MAERAGVEGVGFVALKGEANGTIGASGLLTMIDTFDRPAKAFSTGEAECAIDDYAHAFEDKPGKRLPKAGVVASAGVGHARAEWSIFDADAKGPNVSAGAVASTASLSAAVFAKAELASASATAGPLKFKVGLAADTGIRVCLTGIETTILGTSVSFGRKMGFSFFGSGIEFNW